MVDGVDPLRRAVRERFRRGAHAIKIMTSGGVMSLADPIRIPQYSAEEIRAVTDEAARRGSYVAAHAYSPEAIRHSIDNGVRSIEHGNLLDAETAAAMAAAGAFLVPTLAAYDAMERRGERDRHGGGVPAEEPRGARLRAQAVELARAAGVRVGFGTDLMGVLEDEQLNGLRLQAEVDGIWTALRSATSVNAELIGRPGPRPGRRGLRRRPAHPRRQPRATTRRCCGRPTASERSCRAGELSPTRQRLIRDTRRAVVLDAKGRSARVQGIAASRTRS